MIRRAERPGRTSDGIERDRDVPEVKQAIQFWPARVKLFGQRLLGFLLYLHGLFELPSQDPLDSNRLDFFADSFPFEKTIESRSTVVRSFAALPCVHGSPL